MSLLPEMECIPENYKAKLRNDICSLICSARLAAQKGRKRKANTVPRWRNYKPKYF